MEFALYPRDVCFGISIFQRDLTQRHKYEYAEAFDWPFAGLVGIARSLAKIDEKLFDVGPRAAVCGPLKGVITFFPEQDLIEDVHVFPFVLNPKFPSFVKPFLPSFG